MTPDKSIKRATHHIFITQTFDYSQVSESVMKRPNCYFKELDHIYYKSTFNSNIWCRKLVVLPLSLLGRSGAPSPYSTHHLWLHWSVKTELGCSSSSLAATMEDIPQKMGQEHLSSRVTTWAVLTGSQSMSALTPSMFGELVLKRTEPNFICVLIKDLLVAEEETVRMKALWFNPFIHTYDLIRPLSVCFFFSFLGRVIALKIRIWTILRWKMSTRASSTFFCHTRAILFLVLLSFSFYSLCSNFQLRDTFHGIHFLNALYPWWTGSHLYLHTVANDANIQWQ